mmetsp:Transcript_13695/g.20860  ORF Transcript_13695/g.20860 Transcript_13695/m.20860 type:complete len:86 (+) Transcript_13695:762-1019(+)
MDPGRHGNSNVLVIQVTCPENTPLEKRESGPYQVLTRKRDDQFCFVFTTLARNSLSEIAVRLDSITSENDNQENYTTQYYERQCA